MSSNISISARDLGKCYQIFQKPEDRLKQMLWRRRKQFFREFWALRNVSFEFAKGETVAIIGRNGSGKSTLLQMICGTLNPTEGSVRADGKVAALLELGAGFNPEFTGRENVYLNGALHDIHKEAMDQRFQAIADFAEIDDFLDQPVKTYSSGMYVRLAFAVAIHCDPEILIIDEALAVGDFLFQQKCNRFIKTEFGETTKILVTHDMAAVANLADRALVLHHGELIHDGDPQSAIREYQIAARAEENRKTIGARAQRKDILGEKATIAVPDSLEWTEIPESRLSGTLRAKIRKFAWNVDGEANSASIRNGEKISIDFEVWADEELEEPIIGYQALDRFGNAVFGENTITSGFSTRKLEAGVSRRSIELVWPLVAAGKYAITLGIGSGYDSHSHTIECWAHNVIVLDASANAPVHGMFNVKIEAIREAS